MTAFSESCSIPLMSTKAQRTSIDGIDLITITRPETARTVVMLHGFGASLEDLAPLADHLDPRGAWNWVFPNGIISVPIGPHMVGRAWFPIRMAELEAAAMRGEVIDMAAVLPDGMKEAGRRLASLLGHLRVEPRQLVLGGFSQGAMMATEVALNLHADVRGLLLFSGTLVNRAEWVKALPSKRAVPFFQSHGRSDPLLGFAHAERLCSELREAGLVGDFVAFGGGHEIPDAAVRGAAAFLERLSDSSDRI